MPKILIIDDSEIDRAFVVARIRKTHGCECVEIESGEEAIAYLRHDSQKEIAAALLDLTMPGMDGRTTLALLLNIRPDLQVIAITGSQDVKDVVDLIKLGAVDYIVKPANPALLGNVLGKALQLYALRQEIEILRTKEITPIGFADVIGSSSTMRSCIKLGQRAAASDITVLLTGESGTGKEVMARAIHVESNRKTKPFVAVNCGAIPKELVESTLFGHKKGSFTGALTDSKGKFLEADGGTLFLDEIGELPLEAQVKLLRALQEREIEPVGSGKSMPVNIRIIAATNRHLDQVMRHGHMREDLFYRLNVFPIHMPSLRQRREDIPPLAIFFLKRYGALEKKPILDFTSEAMTWLHQHEWPGNVRELENAIFRAVMLCDGDHVRPEHIQGFSEDKSILGVHASAQHPEQSLHTINLLGLDGGFKNMDRIRDEIERNALAFYHHDVATAAHQLGIGRATLYRHQKTKVTPSIQADG